MSGSLAKTLEDHLEQVITGPPLFDPTGNLPNMVVYPIFPSALGSEPTDIITLSQGLRKGVRLSDTGIVSQVHVDNPLATTVLVGESDILIGATQLRSVQFSCLVPPGRRASLPVNCVEAGQPTVRHAEFTSTAACPWFLRSFKMDQLARHGDTHQYRIWERIREYLEGARTTSSTQDLRAVFREYGADVDSISDLFPLRDGQIGTVCAVGHDLFVELFSDPELLEDRYDHTLHSAIVEAVAHPGGEVTPKTRVDQLLSDLSTASRSSRVVQSRSLKDSGRSLVFSANGISGSALMSGGRLVHLSAHQRCWGAGLPFEDQVDQLSRERSEWESAQGPFLDQLSRDYSLRRKRYMDYKKKLAPVVRSVDGSSADLDDWEEGDEVDSGPAPMPLNPGIHEFFLRLFRR